MSEFDNIKRDTEGSSPKGLTSGMSGQLEQDRTIQAVTLEIKTLHRQFKQIVLGYAIEIGRRLVEAKSMLNHGEWGDWLRDEVEFSQSTANNLMRIFEEYGADQMGLFGPEANSQTLGNLPYTKALKLLAIPAEERETFTEKHDVEHLSTRELDRLIRERDEALTAKNAAEENLDNMVEELSDAQRERDEAMNAKLEAESSLQARLAEQEKRIAADLEAERAKVQELMTKSDDLQKKLKSERDRVKDAKTAAENAKRELEEQKKKPIEVAVAEPSEETLDKLREEAAVAAEEKVKEANARLVEAQAKADAAEAEAEKIRKQLELADQSSVAFKFYFEEWQHKFNAMLGALRDVEQSDQIKAEKLRKAIHAAVEKMGAMA